MQRRSQHVSPWCVPNGGVGVGPAVNEGCPVSGCLNRPLAPHSGHSARLFPSTASQAVPGHLVTPAEDWPKTPHNNPSTSCHCPSHQAECPARTGHALQRRGRARAQAHPPQRAVRPCVKSPRATCAECARSSASRPRARSAATPASRSSSCVCTLANYANRGPRAGRSRAEVWPLAALTSQVRARVYPADSSNNSAARHRCRSGSNFGDWVRVGVGFGRAAPWRILGACAPARVCRAGRMGSGSSARDARDPRRRAPLSAHARGRRAVPRLGRRLVVAPYRADGRRACRGRGGSPAAAVRASVCRDGPDYARRAGVPCRECARGWLS